jgi:hypothetical protein
LYKAVSTAHTCTHPHHHGDQATHNTKVAKLEAASHKSNMNLMGAGSLRAAAPDVMARKGLIQPHIADSSLKPSIMRGHAHAQMLVGDLMPQCMHMHLPPSIAHMQSHACILQQCASTGFPVHAANLQCAGTPYGLNSLVFQLQGGHDPAAGYLFAMLPTQAQSLQACSDSYQSYPCMPITVLPLPASNMHRCAAPTALPVSSGSGACAMGASSSEHQHQLQQLQQQGGGGHSAGILGDAMETAAIAAKAVVGSSYGSQLADLLNDPKVLYMLSSTMHVGW